MRMDQGSAALVPASRVLLVLATLYVAQGIPVGLGFIAFPAILRTLGFSTEAIGLVGIIILPWAIKFLWAPMVDRRGGGRGGNRRASMLPLQFLIAALYAAMAALTPEAIALGWPVIVILLLLNTASATQDIATDGFAVETLRDRQLTWANGLQIGGFSFGMVIGGAATVLAYQYGGWSAAFWGLAALSLLGSMPILALPRIASQQRDQQRPPVIPSLRNAIRRPGAWIMLSTAATFHFALAMARSMQGPFLVDRGIGLADVAIINGTGIASIAVVAALLGSFLIRVSGVVPVAVGGGLVSSLSIALWWLPAHTGQLTFAEALLITVVNGLASGIAYVAFFTYFMQWASPEQAGTDFTVLQCTESCSNILAAATAGILAAHLGYDRFFLVTTMIGSVLLLVIMAALRSVPAQPDDGAQAQDPIT